MATAPVNPEVQAHVDRIRADRRASHQAVEEAAQADQKRIDTLNAAKQVCQDTCGLIVATMVEDDDERAVLAEHQERTHAEHAEALAAAYREFAGQPEGSSNPAAPGVTDLESHSAMSNDVPA